ncbi:DUF6221 family protein [Cryptosporangium sp. NPDC051539]|uniref:DUF6221 family protein n=1 Tax=Cryptosporangium sp. NPDC051539 TaxID=3363962 RepID=UPI003787E8D8
MTTGIHAFLLARYDEIEQTARAAVEASGNRGGGGVWVAAADVADGERDPWDNDESGYVLYADGDNRRDVLIYDEGSCRVEQARHIALHDPASVLLDVALKRRLVDLHDETGHRDCSYCRYQGGDWPCETLRLMAQPFTTHPAYDAAWRPE